jgi:beta-lactamase class A
MAVSTSPLSQRVDQHLSNAPGISGAAIFNLTTGEVVLNDPDRAFSASSTIKIGILYALLRRIDADPNVSYSTTLNSCFPYGSNQGEPDNEIPDLQPFTEYSLSFLARTMIANSNNWATNRLIDFLGFDQINQELNNLGLTTTQLQRYMTGPGAPSNHGNDTPKEDYIEGFDNLSTPREMVELLQQIHQNNNLLTSSSYEFFWKTLGLDGDGGVNTKGSSNNFYHNSIYPDWTDLLTFQNKGGSNSWNTPDLGRHYHRSEAGRIQFNNGQIVFYAAFVNRASDGDEASQTISSIGYEIAAEYADAPVTHTPAAAALDDGRIVTIKGTSESDTLAINATPELIEKVDILINDNLVTSLVTGIELSNQLIFPTIDKVRILEISSNPKDLGTRKQHDSPKS